ncbi:MAG TPA: hypothetical protein DDW52_19470 [Planctomycetaceae bacterium]|nr:hypothetical protein [Planctomycetaceae bacterium]
MQRQQGFVSICCPGSKTGKLYQLTLLVLIRRRSARRISNNCSQKSPLLKIRSLSPQAKPLARATKVL